MQTFTIHLGRSFLRRLFGRHPLVRTSDRVEALAVVLAVFLAMVAIPVVGAMGTAIHETRSLVYAEEALTRHALKATAIEHSEVVPYGNAVDLNVKARWNAFGGNHIEVVPVTSAVKAGDLVDVWVDEGGRQVSAPSPSGRAGEEALGAAVLVWLGVVGTMVGCVMLSRRRLNRTRYAAWDRDLRMLSGGGRFTGGP
ncbi:membrane protein [Mycobacterium antarcticum]|uniref:Rv1733c family protein n=1 Tax=Mycolicibacterium sp. TUM20983 TaxID=3023369 RepID=UPI0023A64D56|nr:hypothetical protein [Mycolicibacterium sp. TUM20983]GLP76777.1 membrane protein [Mycolicibacterium sp. TUM20983]